MSGLATMIIITVLLLASLALAARLARSAGSHRTTTWVCRICHAAFSDPDAAYLHIEVAHPELLP